MPRKPKRQQKSDGTEYRFLIDAYTPDTIPMHRLAEYMAELAVILGERASVHFRRLEPGSTVLVHKIDREAVPKVRDRIRNVRVGDGPSDAMRAYDKMNKMLREDDGVGTLREKPTAVLIRFPGREQTEEKFASIRQFGTIDGEVTWVGGSDQTAHITLLSEGREITRIYTSRAIAKQLGNQLWEPVRLSGRGRWMRDGEGTWCLLDFKVDAFEPLEKLSLSSALAELRAIPADWDNDAYGELDMIRHGPGRKQNGGH
jgi:hypothetical protein